MSKMFTQSAEERVGYYSQVIFTLYPGQSHLRPQSNFFRFPLIAKICAGIEVGSVEDSVDTEYFSLRLGNSLCSYDII